MRLRLGVGLSGGAAAFGMRGEFRASAAPQTPSGPPLRVLADKLGLQIGAPEWLRCSGCSEDPDLDAMLKREYNATITGHFGWKGSEPTQGTPGYQDIDIGLWTVKYKFGLTAQALGPLITPIGFESPAGLPIWLQGMSRSAMIDAINSYVTSAITYVRGKVSCVAVTAEMNSSPGWDWLYDTVGQEYVEIAFAAARKADPAMRLAYYDWGNHTKAAQRYTVTRQITDRLKSLGLIDLVFLEGACYAGNTAQGGPWILKKEDVIDAVQSYGLPIALSEFSVTLKDITGTEDYRLNLQAQTYRTMMDALLESGVCEAVHMRAPCDGAWDLAIPGTTNHDTQNAFDDQVRPKPAYYAVQASLQAAVDRKMTNRRTFPQLAFDRP